MAAQHHLLPEPEAGKRSARVYPQYEFINPLGLTITEFTKNRVSCRFAQCRRRSGATRLSFDLILPFFPEELRELRLDPSISDR